MHAPRLLIVSNRLPVTAGLSGDRVQLADATGGLASGLRGYHHGTGALWIGWPGDVSSFAPPQRDDLDQQLRSRGIVPVHLSADHVERYYHGFANRVLWPLFHYLVDRVPVEPAGWDAYRQVNEMFAEVVTREWHAGDTIWIHDYQLMLLPALLRQRLPSARIGFFLHIPFPSSEVFRALPWRSNILSGLLGADLVGFHTFAYLRHFQASLLHVEGVESEIDCVRVADREIQLGVFPMGVDAAAFASRADTLEVTTAIAAIRDDAGPRRIILGIDRLDYTKGIPRRLSAIERLFDQRPELRDQIRYIQVAVPSRGEVDSYQRFKRQVEEGVGRINGKCGTLGSTPIHYLHRTVTPAELVGLFRAADVMLVTPLRDGMNLVAKEFIASRIDDDGVLVLSEFAGAAAELDGAVVVNPYDVDAVAHALEQALAMPMRDRQERMRRLRRRVHAHDVHAWARTFLGRLERTRAQTTEAPASSEPVLSAVLARAAGRQPIRLLLDYDGTLVPIARAPELAAPDRDLMALLAALVAAPGVSVDIVSGRPRETLERWFGHLPLALWGEHGFWHRAAPQQAWRAASEIPAGLDKVETILNQFTVDTPGSQVERKRASIAWHYRRAEREFGRRQAHELRMLLGDILSNQPLEVVEGKMVIEVRLRGVSKAAVAAHAVEHCDPSTVIVAIGDDRTDEDLFRALPGSCVTVRVGGQPTGARFRLGDYGDVRRVLGTLGAARRSVAGWAAGLGYAAAALLA